MVEGNWEEGNKTMEPGKEEANKEEMEHRVMGELSISLAVKKN